MSDGLRVYPAIRLPSMKRLLHNASLAALLALALSSAPGPRAGPQTDSQALAALEQGFREPPLENRPMMRWWWFGPALDKAQLEREMRLMKEGGIGGFEVQPVYPLAPDDPSRGIRNLPYLGPEFLEALRFTAEKARELGLRFDLTLGTGWPYGGPQIPIQLAASRLRWEKTAPPPGSRRVPLPHLSVGEKFIAAFASHNRAELTDFRDGAVWLPEASDRPGEVWFFISSRTGQQVKRAAYGAEGYVLDHLNRAALDLFLKEVGEPLLAAVGPHKPFAVFCDSLEAYGNDWTDDFLEEFRRRRGYDLRPHLPDLAGAGLPRPAADAPGTLGVQRDWGLTLSELLEERFLAPLAQWARARGTRLRIQGYGTPPARLTASRHADLIEGEGAHWRQFTATRWASSANHLLGRSVTSSETWTWLHSPVYRATPLDVKMEADIHVLQGINHFVGHGWPYTHPAVEYPGWRFYAAGVFNEKNPWWMVMPDVTRYLQRLSYVMQQGRPANDVALYLPEDDTWASQQLGNVDSLRALAARIGPRVIPQINQAGFNLDYLDDHTLREAARVEGHTLVAGFGRYRAVVLPNVMRVPAESLQKLAAFARAGGVVIAARRAPAEQPGLRAPAGMHARVAELARALFEGPAALGQLVEDEQQLGAALAARLTPDLRFAPAAPDVGFYRRSTPAGEIYFLANTGNRRQRTRATFRVPSGAPEWWDPHTGDVRGAAVAERTADGVAIELDLEPFESRLLAFTRRARPLPAPAPRRELAAVDLSAHWQVTFAGGRAVHMDRLRSWTEDEATRFFSGVAVYEKRFAATPEMLRSGARVALDFGEGAPAPPAPPDAPSWHGIYAGLETPVREAAMVTVNGRRAGVLWCPPYRLEVTGLLQPGENRLEIRVANLATNFMAGRPLPDYRLLNLRYGERFQAQDMKGIQALPAGLLGPVRLVSLIEGASEGAGSYCAQSSSKRQ